MSGGVVGASSEETVEERRRWWGEARMGIGEVCLKSFKLESSLRGLSVASDMIFTVVGNEKRGARGRQEE